MNFIDFFAGIGGFRRGLEKAGHKCIGWCEWDKYARQSYEAIHNTEGEWTAKDIRDVKAKDMPKADMWCFGFPCFARDTMILTSAGYKPIQELTTDDIVLTHRGNWKRVTRVMQRDGAELWEVKGFGIIPTITTENHPYYVTKNGKQYEFVKVKELTEEYNTTITLPKEVENKHSAAWWKLAGRYLADGWTVPRHNRPRGGRIVIACNDEKAPALEKMINDAGYNFCLDKAPTCNKYIILNNELYYDLQMFGKYAYGKRLPLEVISLNKEKSNAFLEGYMSGDGCRNELKASTVSPALALGMQMVILRSGYSHPSIYKTHRPSQCTIDGRLCNQRQAYEFRYSEKGKKSFNGNDGYVCRRMEKPIPLHRTGTVYNISVEEDESYIANGAIVHNCTDISVAGKMQGFKKDTEGQTTEIEEGEQTRSGLFYEVIRLLRELPKEDRPKWLIAENVKNLISIEQGWGFARCIVALGEAGYDTEWQVFNTKYSYNVAGVCVPGIPQNRERVYLVSRLAGAGGGRKVFPIQRADTKNPAELQKIAGRWGMNHQAGSIYDKQGLSPALDTCGGGSREPHIVDDDSKVKQIGHIVGYGLENPQPYRVYDESGAAPTLTSASDGKVPMVVDKEVNQIGHGMSKDGKPIQGYGVFDTDGVAPTLTTGHGSAQPYVMDEQKINVLGSYSPSGYNATRVVSPEGIAPTVMENHGQVTAVTIQAVLSPDRLEKRQNGRRIKDDGEPMFTLTTQDRHGIAISDMPQVVGGVGEPNAFGKQFRQGNRIYSTDSVSPALQTNNGNASGGSVLVATEDE